MKRIDDDTDDLQPIRPEWLYPIELFKRITGLGEHWIGRAQRAGMKIHLKGNRRFVYGRDAVEYITRPGGED
jgi:hypothetical protein